MVDASGALIRLTDKESGQPLLRPGQRMNDWRLYKNVQPVYDAWELDRGWETRCMEGCFTTEVTVESSGPACAALRIVRSFGDSHAEQSLRLFAGSRRIDFVTKVDWQERHRMLKVHFQSDILAEEAVHEIQFGYVRRPAHRSTPMPPTATRYATIGTPPCVKITAALRYSTTVPMVLAPTAGNWH